MRARLFVTTCLILLTCCPSVAVGQEPSANASDLPTQYREPFAASWPIRKRQHLQMKSYLDRLAPRIVDDETQTFRLNFTSIDDYEASTALIRNRLVKRNHLPPAHAIRVPKPRFERVGEDRHAEIYRVWVELFQGVEAYAIYMVPKKMSGTAPVIIAIHGGSGCPEAVCDLDTRVNYRSFGPEAVRRGYIVYAPGLLMNVSYAKPRDPRLPDADWQALGRQAESLGINIRSLQDYQIIEGVKAVVAARPEADGERIGVTGLSMGGGYTLSTAAKWTGIKAAACSAGFREHRDSPEAGLDVIEEVALKSDALRSVAVPLICPRPLMIQAGSQDTVVPLESAKPAIPWAKHHYERLGVEDRFVFHVHPGGHVFENEAIFRFFDKHLK